MHRGVIIYLYWYEDTVLYVLVLEGFWDSLGLYVGEIKWSRNLS